VIYLGVGFPSGAGRTRGDILGGVAYVSNWYQIASARATPPGGVRAAAPPVVAAVEEQFYSCWP
jgi:hypothetical protein